MHISKSILALTLTAAFGLAQAQLVEGTDYKVLAQPIPQLQSNKVEVLEFFGYFCIHCYHLDPILLKHAKSFPSDTYLRSEHVVWDPEGIGLARVAAAVNASGTKYQANPAIFKAMFEDKINLGIPATFKQWAVAQTGFDSKKLLQAYDAPSNPAEAKRMQDLTRQYGISSTPTVIVGGKYQVLMRDFNQAMGTIDQLVAKVRQERGMKAVAPKAAVAVKVKGAGFAAAANQ